jgi:anti-anti-sigma factor
MPDDPRLSQSSRHIEKEAEEKEMKSTSRTRDGVEIVKLEGKITIGSGDVQLRDIVNELTRQGKSHILLDMSGVTQIDSSGIGELVGAYTTVTNRGGKLKLLHLPPKVSDLLHVTQLITVFEVHEEEDKAVTTF